MYPVPAQYRPAFRGGGFTAAMSCEVWHVRQNKKVADLDLVDGDVKLSRTAAITRSCDVMLAGFESLIPDLSQLNYRGTYGDGTYGDGAYGDISSADLQNLLVPAVHQLRLWWDLYDEDGNAPVYRIPMGRFRVSKVRFKHTKNGLEARVLGFDITRNVQKAGYSSARVIAKGSNVRDVLITLLSEAVPGTQLLIPTTGQQTPEMTFLPAEGADRWDDCRRIAATAGWELLSTRDDAIIAVPMPQPGVNPPVWTVDEAVLLSDESGQDDDQLINEMVVYGEATGEAPVIGVSRITVGQWSVDNIFARTDYKTSEFVKDAQSAKFMADYELARVNGLTDTNDIETVALPFLDPVDLFGLTNNVLQLQAGVYVLEEGTVSVRPTVPSVFAVSRRLI